MAEEEAWDQVYQDVHRDIIELRQQIMQDIVNAYKKRLEIMKKILAKLRTYLPSIDWILIKNFKPMLSAKNEYVGVSMEYDLPQVTLSWIGPTTTFNVENVGNVELPAVEKFQPMDIKFTEEYISEILANKIWIVVHKDENPTEEPDDQSGDYYYYRPYVTSVNYMNETWNINYNKLPWCMTPIGKVKIKSIEASRTYSLSRNIKIVDSEPYYVAIYFIASGKAVFDVLPWGQTQAVEAVGDCIGLFAVAKQLQRVTVLFCGRPCKFGPFQQDTITYYSTMAFFVEWQGYTLFVSEGGVEFT